MTAHTHDGGRRLALLFEAGPARYALEASRVLEVTPPDPDPERATVRGVFPLEDLSTLMGGAAEARPGLAVLLDTSPTLAVRVREGAEVADVAGAPHFQLTRDLAQRMARWSGVRSSTRGGCTSSCAPRRSGRPACCRLRRRAS